MNARQLMEKLNTDLKEASKSYYQKGTSIISDQDFDMKLRQLEKLERDYPELALSDTITLKVGSDLSPGFEKVTHQVPMLSIQNCYNYGELEDFDGQCVKYGGILHPEYVIEFKIDGVSLALIYEDRKLVQAVTRGDGSQGDDVTENARTISNIPQVLPEGSPEGRFEIRGECYMPRESFDILNERLLASNKTQLQNPRNAASGTLKTKDVVEVYKRGLKFFAFSIVGDTTKQTHRDNLVWLKEMGFEPSPYKRISSISEAIKVIEASDIKRSKLQYDVDGMVIKVNDTSLYEKMGSTSKHPRWLAAWKFKAEAAVTKVTSIDYQVGRTGRITPVANLEPVRLAGTTVKRATLHNFDEIARLGLSLGDTVSLEKGGEIIPKITSVISKSEDSSQIELPTSCPACNSDIEKGEDVDLRCENLECPPQLQRRVQHFVSRNAMNIDAIGPALIEQLIDKGMLKDSPLQLYSIDKQDLLSLERMGEKSAEKVLSALHSSTKNSPEKLLTALGIRHVGKTASKKILEHMGSLSKLAESSRDSILSSMEEISGLGDTVAGSLADFWTSEKGRSVYDFLCQWGFNLNYEKEETGDQFAGETVVLTGTLPTYKRPDMAKLVAAAGATVTGTVTKKTTILIAGDNAGSKLDKAKSLGVLIMSEEEVLARLAI